MRRFRNSISRQFIYQGDFLSFAILVSSCLCSYLKTIHPKLSIHAKAATNAHFIRYIERFNASIFFLHIGKNERSSRLRTQSQSEIYVASPGTLKTRKLTASVCTGCTVNNMAATKLDISDKNIRHVLEDEKAKNKISNKKKRKETCV